MVAHLIEFATSHYLLVGIFVVLLVLLIVTEARKGGRSLSSGELTALVNSDKGLVIDIRTSKDYAAGHIVGALNIPQDKFAARIGELLRWPGVLKSNSLPPEVLQQLCLDGLKVVLEDFRATRGREGEKLAQVLRDRLESMAQIISDIKPRLPLILDAYRAKLSARLQEALGNVDDDRIKQEFALFAQKIDVDEELERLSTHLSEIRRILKTGGQVGKRLDFLMQELNREANTLGSKAFDPRSTQAAVNLKVLIEQMREQVQNIE